VKTIERVLKLALAWTMALWLWRPGRTARVAAKLAGAKRILLVRLDNRVGEALLTTPLIAALEGRQVELLVHEKCVRVLEGVAKVRAFDARMKWLGALAPGIRALRDERFDVVVDCGSWSEPSVTALLISRLIARDGVVIGPAIGPGQALLDVAVTARTDTQSEVLQRLHLLSPLGISGEARPLRFRAVKPSVRPYQAVVNPGGRLDYRRVPAEVFSGVCRQLVADGRPPIVTWGPGEEALAKAVVAGAPGSVLAPPTNLDELGELMRGSNLTICNNTGPMHLSVALKVPTVGLFLHMPIERWGHPEAPHRMIDLTSASGSIDAMVQAVIDALPGPAREAR
jgi:ADP-heptose:LPS heptosyltransferase